MRRLSIIDILWAFTTIYVAVAVGLAETEEAISANVAARPEMSVHVLKTEERTSGSADALMNIDTSTTHVNESGRQTRQFRTFGFGRPFGYGRPYGFGRPLDAAYGGYGGFGRLGGGGFGRPYVYFPRPYYLRPYFGGPYSGGPCCFYG